MFTDKDEIGGDQTGEVTPPEVKPETTPKGTEEDVVTLSSKEHKELLSQAKAASELGRTVKGLSQSHATLKSTLDDYSKRYTDLETNFRTFRDRDRETELEKYKDDTGMLDAIRMKYKVEDEREDVKRQRSDFDKEKTQYQADLEEARKQKAENLAKELAADSGLTATILLQIGTDTTDGKTTYNLERMKTVAKSVSKEGVEEEGAEEENPPAVRGQRSRAAGAGNRSATRGLQTMEDYDRAYNEGRISSEEYAKARVRFGVAY